MLAVFASIGTNRFDFTLTHFTDPEVKIGAHLDISRADFTCG
jgi:hypothetical protein